MLSLLLALAVGPAHAADLSLDDALAAARDDNPQLQAAGLVLDQQRASLRGALATSDPTLTLASDRGYTETVGFLAGTPLTATTESQSSTVAVAGQGARGTRWSLYSGLSLEDTTTASLLAGPEGEVQQTNWSTEVGGQLEQDLLAPWKRSPQLEARLDALVAVERAQLEAYRTEQDVLAEVAGAWWDAWLARERVALAEQGVAEAQRLVERTTALVAQGSALAVDASRAELALLDARQALLSAQSTAAALEDVLLLQLGRSPTEVVTLSRGVATDAGVQVPTLDTVLAGSPTLALAQRDLEAARRRERDAQRDRLPELTASVGGALVTLEETAPDALASLSAGDRYPRWSAGLSLSVPLGGRSAKATADRRGAEVRQAELQVQQQQAALEADYAAAVDRLRTAEAAGELAMARLTVAGETESAEAVRVDAGTRHLDDLLDARDDRRTAEVGLLEARVDVARAGLSLARLAGAVDGVR